MISWRAFPKWKDWSFDFTHKRWISNHENSGEKTPKIFWTPQRTHIICHVLGVLLAHLNFMNELLTIVTWSDMISSGYGNQTNIWLVIFRFISFPFCFISFSRWNLILKLTEAKAIQPKPLNANHNGKKVGFRRCCCYFDDSNGSSQ